MFSFFYRGKIIIRFLLEDVEYEILKFVDVYLVFCFELFWFCIYELVRCGGVAEICLDCRVFRIF